MIKQWSGGIKNEQSKSNSVRECGEVAITLSHTEFAVSSGKLAAPLVFFFGMKGEIGFGLLQYLYSSQKLIELSSKFLYIY